MVLGQVHDFKNIAPLNNDTNPDADVTVPEDTADTATPTPTETASPTATTVTIQSIEEGEQVTSTKPEFFGEAPSNLEITVKVESTPQIDIVTADEEGNWNWTPPKDLDPGVHKITLSWKDANGILKTITKNFIVQAAEGEPAFTATQSASPTATPKTTTTPKPTATPKSTASPSEEPEPTETAEPQPESGSLTPTYFLLMMSMGVLALGVFAWKKSQI